MSRFIEWLVTFAFVVFCLLVATLIIVTPMGLRNQLVFGVITVASLFLIARIDSPRAKLVMVVITVISATRYLYWRITETVVIDELAASIFSVGLICAEIYAWLVLVLSFFQTARPLERKIEPLPADTRKWPTVDVYIPTYNEPLEVVRDTVLAATNLDYPADKFNVYLLDDGRRPEFGAFAANAGVGYITRDDNKHAKAGNLNNALKRTNGELICVFDCDHITTRAFLQATVGAFAKQENLALIQAPHHFYSPDPFERNLVGTEEVPHEGALFYGPVQKGNDYWDATFFCGSCAVIRRDALDSIGGFAVETVTEDAHTALKLQRKGWSTAYLGLPLASGLATERLALHIVQRGRWCRGMTQILRIDNPIFGRGLKLSQRLCYLSAMLHFQFPIARFVFLTAPLLYLLFGLNIIEASPQLGAAYVIPHLFSVVYTNAKMVGKYRYTFWNEIYETVLTFHLLKPSLLTLLDPTKGKFDVTDKGGLLEKGFIDFRVIQPHIFLIFLLLCAMGWGVARVLLWYPNQISVLVFNMFWAVLSVIFLLAAISVANERRQVRRNVRIDLNVPVVLHMVGGYTYRTTTQDISMGGMRVRHPDLLEVPEQVETVELYHGDECMIYPVHYVDRGAREDKSLSFVFGEMELEPRRHLLRLVMGRPDAWVGDMEAKPDRPMHSLGIIFSAIGGFFGTRWTPLEEKDAKGNLRSYGIMSSWTQRLILVLLVGLGILLSTRSVAQPAAADTAATPAATTAPNTAPSGGLPNLGAAAAATASLSFDAEAGTVRRLTLEDLGMAAGLRIQGNGAQAGLGFSTRRDQVITSARLELDLRYSSLMQDESSYLDIIFNGIQIERLFLSNFNADGLIHILNIPPELLIVHNQLDFRLSGETRNQCSNLLSEDIWVEFDPGSSIRLASLSIPAPRDLGLFPEPFIDEGDMFKVEIPIVYPAVAAPDLLRAGMLVASYMGALADYREASFPVVRGRLPDANAILLITNGQSLPDLNLPLIDRPMILQVEHPLNPLYQLLVLAGRDAREVQIAANYLALRGNLLTGRMVEATALPLPSVADQFAPAWQRTDDLIYLSQMAPDQMAVRDVRSAARRFTFRLPADLYLWPGNKLVAQLDYRFPDGNWIDKSRSRLEIMLNGEFLTNLPAEDRSIRARTMRLLGRDSGAVSQRIRLNSQLLYGNNELTIYFNMAIKETGDCNLGLPASVNAGLLSTSYLDLRESTFFSTLPDLSLFASGSFPFTRRPDLSRTVVVLPEAPDDFHIEAAFNMVGRIGAYTGLPAYGVDLKLGLNDDARMQNADLLVISEISALESSTLLRASPYVVRQEGLALRGMGVGNGLDRWLRAEWSTDAFAARTQLGENGRVDAFISFKSPLNPDRDVVVLTSDESAFLPMMVQALSEPEINAGLFGDLAIFGTDPDGELAITSYRIGTQAPRGNLAWHERIRWNLGQYVIPMLFAMVLISIIVASLLYSALEARARRRLNPHKARR